VTKRSKSFDRRATPSRGTPVPRPAGTHRGLSNEAEAIIDAIRAGQIDALVIPGPYADKVYAIKSFDDLEKVDLELKSEGSARQRSDTARNELERRFETLAMYAPVGIYIADATGNCTFFNRGACQIIGLPSEDALGQGWTKAVHPDDRNDVLKQFNQAASSDRVVDAEFRFVHQDGQTVWVAARTIKIQGEDGAVTGTIGTITDITAHKIAELSLQEANERLQVVLDASPVAIISVDPAGQVIAWSQGAERMFGWTEKEVLGRINPTVPDGEMGEFHEKIRRVLAGGTFKGQLRHRRTKSGNLIHAVISARPLPDRSSVNSGIVLIVDDITEEERANEQLRALAEARERFFQDMHDGCIQSIYAVGLNLEACRPLIGINPTRVAQIVAAASANLDLVIQDLRSFMNEDGQQLPAAPNLRAEIARAVQATGEKGLVFELDIDAAAEDELTPDQAFELLQIAREGISNANRHAKARSGRVSLQIRNAVVCFEVADDGKGFQVTAPKKRGLGLHHIDARARRLAGQARIVTAPGKGTRVVVEIPLKR
jgi:PAS domain S-box-containing protein